MISDFFAEQDLTFEHVKSLAAGMFAVARVDGVHDREMAMIREFYEGCARVGDPRLEDVVGSDFDLEGAKALFPGPDLSRLFIKSMILLAFADGTYAKLEDDLIRRYAEALDLDDGDVDRLHEATKDYLLASLAHVANVEALAAVAKRLDLASP